MDRRFSGLLAVMAMLAGSLLGAECVGRGSSSSTKPDPNAGLYGAWAGELNVAFPGASIVETIYLVVESH